MTRLDELLADATSEQALYAFREERKYRVPHATAQALGQALGERLLREEFVPGRGRSRVHSIYFDGPDLPLYRESLAEGNNLKVRLRTYGDVRGGDEAETYLECKLGVREAARRKKRKLRWALTPTMLASLLEGRHDALLPTAQPKFWHKALDLMAARALRPVLTVCYDREAYVSADGRLRVTLDTGYVATRLTGLETPLGGPRSELPGSAILEIKLLDALPAWLDELLAAWGLPAEGESFSKYRTAVPQLFDGAAIGVADEAS